MRTVELLDIIGGEWPSLLLPHRRVVHEAAVVWASGAGSFEPFDAHLIVLTDLLLVLPSTRAARPGPPYLLARLADLAISAAPPTAHAFCGLLPYESPMDQSSVEQPAADGSRRFKIEPDSIKVIYGGFENKKKKK